MTWTPSPWHLGFCPGFLGVSDDKQDRPQQSSSTHWLGREAFLDRSARALS